MSMISDLEHLMPESQVTKGKQGETTNDKGPEIVDIHGLAEVLKCSVQTLYKTWREYPHVFIGLGRTAKSARFDVNDVFAYLRYRDYTKEQRNAISGYKRRTLDRPPKTNYTFKKAKTRPRIPTPNGSIPAIEDDPYNLCEGLRSESENQRHAEYWKNRKY